MKDMMRIFGIFLLLGGALSCGDFPNDGAPVPVYGEAFTLQHGQSLSVLPDNMLFTFAEVEEDSRCPVGVQCLWAGQVIVKVKVQKGTEIVYERLGLGTLPTTGPGSEVIVFGRTVKLLSVNPYPEEFTMQLPVQQTDYSIELVVD